jgi:predicted dehydrogenase
MQRIAIVGFKFMGSTHAQIYHKHPTAELSAIVDRNPDRATCNLEKLGLRVPVYPSLEALLNVEEIDVVDICAPTDVHLEFCLQAIAARKHLFCEKPIALNLIDAEKICQAVADGGIFAQVGHCIRFWPEYQALTKLIQSGSAGKLLGLGLQRRSARPPFGNKNWLNDPTRSGGAALDLHIHDTDYIFSLFGMPPAVTSVGLKDERGWSAIQTIYHYDHMAIAAEGSWTSPENWNFQMAFHAEFERATVEFDSRREPTLTITREGEITKSLSFDVPTLECSHSGLGNISALGGYQNELAYFIDCLEKGKRPQIATPEQARDTLRIVLSEIESAEMGCTVSLK